MMLRADLAWQLLAPDLKAHDLPIGESSIYQFGPTARKGFARTFVVSPIRKKY
jgi:hypothetical protein